MLHPNAENVARNIVADFLSNRIPFTSVDITSDIRDQGLFAKHRDVAEWLRRNVIQLSYEMSALYNQTLIEVNSQRDGLTRAYLYHHMDFNPDDYRNRGEQPVSVGLTLSAVQQPSSYHSNNSTPAAAGGLHHSNYQKRDAGGRFSY